ncbi:hypothetical protein [Streptomyces sp. NPDC005805]|uniref:hypothetical protein n=1 Tax=Streptomyces sp. NPDC005805 TaxID=3157068 RepID=UPI003403BFDD
MAPGPGTPVLPVPVPGLAAGRPLAPDEAHRVLLHCALDAAGVRLSPADHQAIEDIARLDFPAVNSVITWLSASAARS